MRTAKPFEISKQLVWKAYQQVKANRGSPGIDDETLAEFENNLKNNLYRIWNRMSSGTYFPPAVKGVLIPKKSGGNRLLGIPTVSDRVAQTVVKIVLETILDPVFDKNSFGYRPNKSAHDAIAVTRSRCWEYDWVVEFDIKCLFDNINHDLLMKALRHHCKCDWVLLYVERWIKTPLQHTDGTIVVREKGTPQGGVVSPILANLFLHYAFDAWVKRRLPNVPFCRYADDGLLHCRSKRQAEYVLKAIEERFRACGLEVHPDKSGIIYCKDKNRKEGFERISFDFLGFTFRPRRCVNGQGVVHPNFLPAISQSSRKAIYQEIRSWHIQLMNEKSLTDLAMMFDSKIRGWLNYYGKFYKSATYAIGKHINWYLIQWVRRKHKGLARHKRRARQHLARMASKNSHLFTHWKLGWFPRLKVVGAE